MKRFIYFIAILFSTILVTNAQEHGPVVGGIYGGFDGKVRNSDGKDKFSFSIGYQYRIRINSRFSSGITLQYGTHKSEWTPYYTALSGTTITPVKLKGHSISLIGDLRFSVFHNLYLSLGLAPTFYFGMNKIKADHYNVDENNYIISIDNNYEYKNEINPVLDVPLSGAIGYSFKYFDLQLSYTHGLCNLMNNEIINGNMKIKNMSLSLYIPLFNKNR